VDLEETAARRRGQSDARARAVADAARSGAGAGGGACTPRAGGTSGARARECEGGCEFEWECEVEWQWDDEWQRDYQRTGGLFCGYMPDAQELINLIWF